MRTIREQFEEIWPVPDGIEWSMNIGRYVCNDDIRLTQERINKAIEYDLRLDTFTRCQESQAIVTSMNDELLEALEWAMDRIGYSKRTEANSNYCDQVDKAHAAIAKAKREKIDVEA